MDYCGPGRCERCPTEVRLDNLGGLVGSWMPQAQRYPVAGSERLSLDSIPYDDPHEVDRQSGAWGSRIPLGAGGGQGSGEGKHRIDTRMAFPDGRRAPQTRYPGAPEECSICFDDAKVLTSAECGDHLYCELCLASHIAERLTSGRVPTCPMPGCPEHMGPDLVKRLLAQSPRLWEGYKLLSLKANKRYETCPYQGCGASVFLTEAVERAHASIRTEDGRRFEPGLETAVRCPSCKKTFCMICSEPAHPRSTCEEAKRIRRSKGSGSSRPSLPPDTKECPRCGNGIQKADEASCDHMTCTRCKKEFCWTCCADREVIYHHGNHYHKPYCRFYCAYDGRDAVEYKPAKCTECRRRTKPCKPPTSED
mmetsp:Transcript_86255/g.224908  ORF Transcript_86255/g.224908 Transcript_86255/m.224908 type:complete len:365 (-) Transcript_86255:59-1153(-)